MKRPSIILLSAFALVFTLAGASAARDGADLRPLSAPSGAKTVIQVYKSPTCGCCTSWVEHIRDSGFQAEVIDVTDEALQQRKSKLGVGPRLASCHTAIVNGYVVEGHVPAADIKRMLSEKPAIIGIAAPGMPVGSPGMEVPGGRKDKYDVVAFSKGGATRVFASH
ncbi:MAG: DUF411 domain-containing protein [Gemmatimonadetes bacterium]|jgi:hypothetical protein|nr:DUF411 domain-containing protein [Gemmatimonadota bacterium]MBP9105911.1 DUF411 domain-containing protein [Gemmatimonadaceae bacterium]MBK6457393.1 DUF411 domain-containing protein [Gemmatimonadota bacterium]MBK6842605.1 DUF411 domain-containing protein [Gemmatimonadota bacterium]MBK7831011.1 DUF411 domain-containing protein [Gemmatimonadota bacterium]